MGVELKAYSYKPNASFTTDPLFLKEDGNHYFYQNDHLGTPQKMTGVNGAIVWVAKYGSFGEATIDPSSTIINPLRFPGQYFDQETGLNYNYFRYYYPRTGRYSRADPIGLQQWGNHLYVYVGNSPLMSIDPLGLLWIFVRWKEHHGYWKIFSLKIKIDTTLYAVCKETCTDNEIEIYVAYESIWDWVPPPPRDNPVDPLFDLIEAIKRAKERGSSLIEAMKKNSGQRFCDALN